MSSGVWRCEIKMSIREIARRTVLARNTVKKHLRSDETEPNYERRVSSSKLDPYAEKLATWLGIEATEPREQRRTLRQIYTISLIGDGLSAFSGLESRSSRRTSRPAVNVINHMVIAAA
jgi:hypothetical protein